MANKITLPLPEELQKKIEEKIIDTNFKSVQEYIIFVLEQMVFEEENETVPAYTKEEEKDIAGFGYTEDEEEKLKENLKDLGYI